MKNVVKLWIGITILIILSPLGLLLPKYFNSGEAWGEWSADTIKGLAGYIPKGLGKLSNFWSAPIPDYAFRAGAGKSLGILSFEYVVSAVIGILVIVFVTVVIGRFLSRTK